MFRGFSENLVPYICNVPKIMLCKTNHFVTFSKKFFSEIDLIFYKILAFDIRWVSNEKYTDVDHGIVQKNRNWT